MPSRPQHLVCTGGRESERQGLGQGWGATGKRGYWAFSLHFSDLFFKSSVNSHFQKQVFIWELSHLICKITVQMFMSLYKRNVYLLQKNFKIPLGIKNKRKFYLSSHLCNSHPISILLLFVIYILNNKKNLIGKNGITQWPLFYSLIFKN